MSEHERLTRELRDRADQVGGRPLDLADVKRSANRIKWQRRAGATAVAAAVLAVAAPVGFTILGDGGNDTPPVAGPSPSETASSPPTSTEKVRIRTDVGGGGEPMVTYVLRRQIVPPGESPVDVRRDYADVTRFAGGWLGLYGGAGGTRFADVLGADGSVVRTFPSTWNIAVTPQGDQVAVFDASATDGELKLYDAVSGVEQQSWDFQEGVVAHPLGILRDDTVVYTTEGPDQVTMIATPGRTGPLVGAITAGGAAYGSGLVTGMTKVDDMAPESCWNVFDAATGDRQWPKDRCAYSLGRFSPDERLVLGHPSYRDGIGDRTLAILDVETGRALVEYSADDMSFVADAVWEDNSHVAAMVYGEDGWHLMRFDTDGDMADLSGPLPGADVDKPVALGAAP